MKNKIIIVSVVSILAILLAACGGSSASEPTPDVVAVRTSAASTVEARFTLTAAAFTPTFPPPPPAETVTPEPEATETQASAEATSDEPCDKYEWGLATVDVNYPDDTPVTPGQDFIKTWRVKNIGTCTWGAGYTLVYAGYTDKMSGQPVAFGEVLPGQEVEVSVQFKAPNEAGSYVSAWTIANAAGIPFFGNEDKPLYVRVLVQ